MQKIISVVLFLSFLWPAPSVVLAADGQHSADAPGIYSSISGFLPSLRPTTRRMLIIKLQAATPQVITAVGLILGYVSYQYHKNPDEFSWDGIHDEAIQAVVSNQYLVAGLGVGYATSCFSGAQEALNWVICRTFRIPQKEDNLAIFLDRLHELHDKIETFKKKGPIQQDYAKPLHEALKDIQSAAHQMMAIESLKEQYTKLERAYDVITAFPTATGIVLSQKESWKKVYPLIESYSPEVKKSIACFLFSISHSKGDSALNHKLVLYFLGEPGTGKTTFAKAFARALDLPLVAIDCASKKGGEGSGLRGGQTSYGNRARNILNLDGISKFATAMGQMKGRFGILFFDEVEKILNNKEDYSIQSLIQDLLELLNPEEKTFHERNFMMDIDVSRLIIILAGNALPDSSAIRSRLQVITFDGFSLEVKMSLAEKEFKVWSQHYELPKNKELYGKVLHDIVTYDQKKELKGVRILKAVVKEYATHIGVINSLGVEFGDFNIEKAFASHGVGEEDDVQIKR
jgi:hypothetical protein